MTRLSGCPSCSASLKGEPMDPKHFEHDENSEEHKQSAHFHLKYLNDPEGCSCLPYGSRAPEDRFYRREIGVQVSGVYDGVLYWMCPDCGHTWHRFAEGTALYNRAEKAMNVTN